LARAREDDARLVEVEQRGREHDGHLRRVRGRGRVRGRVRVRLRARVSVRVRVRARIKVRVRVRVFDSTMATWLGLGSG